MTGTHNYNMEGIDQLTVTITDSNGGATTVAGGSATIADAPPIAAATQPPVTTTEGQPFSGAVAAFSAIFGTYAKPINELHRDDRLGRWYMRLPRVRSLSPPPPARTR